jgi:hypothetical protein
MRVRAIMRMCSSSSSWIPPYTHTHSPAPFPQHTELDPEGGGWGDGDGLLANPDGQLDALLGQQQQQQQQQGGIADIALEGGDYM